MAISKTQPMRSAEIELVDSVNQLEVELATEGSSRMDADAALDDRIDDEILAREGADTEIAGLIGTGFSSSNTVASNIENLQDFDGRFRIGITEAYTIAASASQAFSVTFNNPYEATDAILAVVNPIASVEPFTALACVLDSAGPLGLSATITNSDAVNAYTVALGFIAVKVN